MKGLSLPLKPLKKQKYLDIPVSIMFDFALVLIEWALPESLKLKKSLKGKWFSEENS